jgi:hypothetical protein
MIQINSYNPITPIQPIVPIKGNDQDFALNSKKDKKDSVEISKEAQSAFQSISTTKQLKITKEESTQTKAEIEKVEIEQSIKKAEDIKNAEPETQSKQEAPQNNQNTGYILNLVG